MKLYLSSYLQGDQPEKFLEPNARNNRVAVIQNAHDCWTDPVKRKSVFDREYEGLIRLGLEPEELDLRDFFGLQDELREEVSRFAYCWAMGGDSFRYTNGQTTSSRKERLMNGEKTYAIRRLAVGEAELYRSVRLEALRESPEAFSSSYEAALGRSMESWANQADEAADGGDRAIFIVEDGGPVGLAALYRDTEISSHGELIQMWIAPSHRRSGVGEALLGHLFDWAARHSYAAVKAEVTDGNQRALRFYLRCGFTELHSQEGVTFLVKMIQDPQIGLRPATNGEPKSPFE